jgi:hypothetical protein
MQYLLDSRVLASAQRGTEIQPATDSTQASFTGFTPYVGLGTVIAAFSFRATNTTLPGSRAESATVVIADLLSVYEGFVPTGHYQGDKSRSSNPHGLR